MYNLLRTNDIVGDMVIRNKSRLGEPDYRRHDTFQSVSNDLCDNFINDITKGYRSELDFRNQF